MNRILVSLSTIALLGVTATAQCFETNFGTLLGTGDDTLFTLQPMNITFPMGGVAASYTHIQVNTNGAAFLSDGTAPVGATSTGYSTTAATMVNNLRGSAGATQAPRIAPYWRDLNMIVGNNGGVYLNNSLPGKCVITWANAVHYNNNPPIFTFQAQLFDTGVVQFFYSGTAQNYNTSPICGISQGAAVADPGVTDLSAGATGVSTSKIVYQTFATANTFDLQTTTIAFVPNAGGGYDTVVSPCVPATNTSYGGGCSSGFASAYEYFATAAAFDLQNSGVSMVATGTGYVLQPLQTTFVAPSAAAVTLATGDDGQATATLSAAFPYVGGTTTTLSVCGNGFVSAVAQTSMSPNFWTPNAAGLLNAGQTAWFAWHDFNQTIVGSGAIKFEEVGGIGYVTWDGVWDYGGTSVADASTMQFQFDTATGNVHLVFGAVSALGTSGTGFAVGYSPGGPSFDSGNRDLSTALPITTGVDVPPLTLAAAPLPVLGSTLVWTTSNIPATALLSAQLISLGQVNPGLAIPGAPGCLQLVDLSLAATVALFNTPTDTYTLALPNNAALVGLPLNSQSASLDLGANTLGVITSNGVRSVVNSF